MRPLVIVASLVACSFEPGRLPVDGRQADAPTDADAAIVDAADIDAPNGQLILAVNIAGGAHVGTDFAGTWAADPGTLCNGSAYELVVDVANTVDDPLFTNWQYSFDQINCTLGSNLPSDDYELTLVFGEIWIGPGCPYNGTERIFDVLIEGTRVEQDLNTVTVGGCCHPSATSPGMPFKRVYTRPVTDGTMNVTLRAASGEQALLSAVMLRRL